jgi:mannose-1-phosphate guanylyltransferase
MSILNHAHAVILAGGSGTRFWPASRRKRPKQLLRDVFVPGTLLERTVERIRPLIPADRVHIFTNTLLKPQIGKLLPQVPRSQIVAEPAARNTAPTLGLAAHEILRRDPDGMMVILPSDHLIAKPAVFRQVLRAALDWAATEGRSALVGVNPAWAHTGFGYIRRGSLAGEVRGQKIYQVASFQEKPDPETAAGYLASGDYFWNGGMFIWRAATLVANLERFEPEMADGLAKIARAGGAASSKTLNRIYPKLKKISIDYAVAERAAEAYVIPADFGWSDVGSWSEVYAARPRDAHGNARPKRSFCLDAQGNLISAKRFVAAVGVRDLIIIETDDAILVADRNRTQDVGKAVTAMAEKGWDELL